MTIPPKRVLIVPGTSLVGIEILQSLQSLPGFTVHGAGIDVQAGIAAGFSQYDYLPRVDDEDFASEIQALVERDSIDYVYPANDLAISAFSELGFNAASLISHPAETVRIAGSKIATHSMFAAEQIVPARVTGSEGAHFPLFSKPDVSHSSIGAEVVPDQAALDALIAGFSDFWQTHLVTELLTTDEVTVDCFSTAGQGLVYVAARTRDVADNGVSVVTTDYRDDALVRMARLIDNRLSFTGPWFFQAKRNDAGDFRLMEIGARLAGASGIRRAQGVNLAQLAILAADGLPVAVYETSFSFVSRRVDGVPQVESDEPFEALYVDLDDTLILNGAVNVPVEALARHVKSLGLYVAIITRHAKDPYATLRYFQLDGLFDDVFHLMNGEPKSSFIRDGRNSVLLDDSFSERISCSARTNILAVDASSAHQVKRLFDGD